MTAGCNVIVGGGQAGGRAAQAMRRAGFTGDIVLIGAEARPPYERPPLSKEFLLKGGDAKIPSIFADAVRREHKIALKLGIAAVAIERRDRRVILADGVRQPYDRLLLATGSRLRRLAMAGADRANVHYLRTIEDSLAIERRLGAGAMMLVVGGGFIGLEVAAIAAHRGARVMVVEAAPQLVPRLGCPIVADFLARYHRANGIDVRLGVGPTEFQAGSLVDSVCLSDGSRLAVDLVVVGIGVAPETALAEAAGLAVDDGIVTDEFCATSDPAIFAAGDVTRHFNPTLGRRLRLESWHNAQYQAEAAGRAMAGRAAAYAEIPWMWSDQHVLNIQVAGAPASVSDLVVRGDVEGGDFAVFQFAGATLVGAVTVNRGREMPIIRRMLAARRLYDRHDLANPDFRLRDVLK